MVGRYIKLKRRGKNLVGLCPFHNEKTPSFNVHPDDGFYKCFGCGASGDVIKFLEHQTGQDFPSVVKSLAAEVGVEVPDRKMSPQERARKETRDALLRINERAQLFFRTKLAAEDEGRNARAYLKDQRKLDDDIIEHFGLGFGGARDNGLLEHLDRNGVPADKGIDAGVLRDGRRGPYDFFRSRVTFPIRDPRGKLLTFAGRIFGPGAEGRPKYVNGPQTPLYDKSSVLYGLYEALPGLKKGRPAVLVEGQVDVIATHRAGVPTGVAPCGTSLTPRHVEAIKRYTPRVVLCLDADAAGQAATERAVLLCLNGGLEVAIAELVDGDPDDLVNRGDAEALAQRVEGARPALDLYIERAVERSAGSMNARIRALKELLPFLAARGPDELARRQYIKRAARAFHEDEEFLNAEIEKIGRASLAERTRAPRQQPAPRRAPAPQPPRRPAPAKPPEGPRARPPTVADGRTPVAAASSEPPPWADDAPPPDAYEPYYDDEDAPPPPVPDEHVPMAAPAAPTLRPPPRAAPAPAVRWSAAERGLVTALICHPQLAPRCGVLLEGMRNPELRHFLSHLTDALVRFHNLAPREVLLKVQVPPGSPVIQVLQEVYFQRGMDMNTTFLSEGAAAEMIEAYVATLEKRGLMTKLKELQRGIEAATERGDLQAAETLMKSQQVVVAGLKRAEEAEESPALPPSRARLRLVEPSELQEGDEAATPMPSLELGPGRRAAEDEDPDDLELAEEEDFAW